MRTLGVIGGLGPMATAYFMQLVVEMTDASVDQEHIEMIVHSKPQIPDRTQYILKKSPQNPLPEMIEIEKSLIQQGAEVIAIPCITAHFFQPDLERVGCQVIHGIEETGKYLKEENITSVGIMATDGTIESELFQSTFNKYGIVCEIPGEERQKDVMHLIYDDIKAGKKPEMERFIRVKDELKQKGAQVILLGCTELSLLKKEKEIGSDILDVMEVLARQSVISCGKLKKEYYHLITGERYSK